MVPVLQSIAYVESGFVDPSDREIREEVEMVRVREENGD